MSDSTQAIGWRNVDHDALRSFESQREEYHAREFRKLRAEFLKGLFPDQKQAVWVAEEDSAKAAGHEARNVGEGMFDRYHCSCGWESRGYFDGADLGEADWLWHVMKEGVNVDYPGYPHYRPLELLLQLKQAAREKAAAPVEK